jgi:hypothetical protein
MTAAQLFTANTCATSVINITLKCVRGHFVLPGQNSATPDYCVCDYDPAFVQYNYGIL